MLSEEEKKILERAEEIRKRHEAELFEAGEETTVLPKLKREVSGAGQGTSSEGNRTVRQSSSVSETRTPAAERSVYARPAADTEELKTEYANRENTRTRRAVYEEEAVDECPAETVLTGEGGEAPEKKKKKKKRMPVVVIILLILIALVLIIYFVLFFLVKGADYQPYDEITEESSYDLPGKGEKLVKNILLIGTDARNPDEDSRSDVNMVVSICPLQHKIYLTSILRDSYVDIPGHEKNRINMAYQYGGARLLVQTIEQNFQIRIDNYIKVDFFSFIDIIDTLGGVELDITQEELQYVDGYLVEVNQILGYPNEDSFIYEAGTHLCNGRQALAYSRIRYIGTDFGRTLRQRTVLSAVMAKAKSNPFKAISAIRAALPEMVTDLNDFQLAFLAMRLPFLLTYEIESN